MKDRQLNLQYLRQSSYDSIALCRSFDSVADRAVILEIHLYLEVNMKIIMYIVSVSTLISSCMLVGMSNEILSLTVTNKLLLEAAGRHHINDVRDALSGGADVNVQDIDGNTPLMNAMKWNLESWTLSSQVVNASNKQLATVTLLLKARADVKLTNNNGKDAVWNAINDEGGDFLNKKLIELLLANGVDENDFKNQYPNYANLVARSLLTNDIDGAGLNPLDLILNNCTLA